MIINGAEYVTGVYRGDNGDNMATHLYKGTFTDPGFPMCSRGWQRKWYDKNGKLEDWEYSIFRNNTSNKGLCLTCIKRATKGLKPFERPYKTIK
jgi:hypothetical protein